jgi:lysophospholipid acyltransferase (LPLAT)-like uncharacterized protein
VRRADGVAQVGIFSAKRITGARWFQKAVGVAGAEYLRLVWNTNRITVEPPNIYDQIEQDLPAIFTMWHGQHFLVPFAKKPHYRAKVLISRHRDGEINAIAAEWLGTGTIRGSGTHGDDFTRKGGGTALARMVMALREGTSVVLTADVPKVSRVCGLGVVKLASLSERAIYPVAIATRRRIVLDNWDRTAISLPFGRGALVVGTRVRVPGDADETALETARRAVEDSLNAATVRAYALADGDGERRRG